jgi:hypothetical protein
MTLTAIKDGGWGAGDLLTHEEMNDFQTKLLKCIDGYGGGIFPNSAYIQLLGTFVSSGTTVINGDSSTVAGGTLTLSSGATTLQSPTTITAPVYLQYTLTQSGIGRIRKSVVTGANADHTYKVSDANIVAIDSPALTAIRDYTLSTTDAANGDIIEFMMMGTDGSYNVEINYGGSQPVVMNASVVDKARTASFLYYSSAWHPFQVIENQ